MKTIKVIDLLNKIANNEEVPEKIKKYGYVYTYHNGVDYKNEDGGYLFGNLICICSGDLNSTVEIIEEDKEIEELNLDTDKLRGNEIVRSIDYLLEGKINEIVRKVNELKKGK